MDLRTSGEFAQWFSSLDEPTAEDVAATLEVIVQLGTEREAPGSTDWVTWYEHPSLAERFRDLRPDVHPNPDRVDPVLARLVHEWGEFNGYARRVAKHLASNAFVARLAHLRPADAAAVTDAVARIKKAVTRRGLAMSDLQVKRRFGAHALSPREEAELRRLVDVQEIRGAYLAALAAAGFEGVDLPAHSQALREIALRDPPPGLRLLYGMDVKKKQGLVIVGERFDRSFYGDSVRRAEQQWREFLGGELAATSPAGAR